MEAIQEPVLSAHVQDLLVAWLGLVLEPEPVEPWGEPEGEPVVEVSPVSGTAWGHCTAAEYSELERIHPDLESRVDSCPDSGDTARLDHRIFQHP